MPTPDNPVRLVLEGTVSPSESPAKVAAAIAKLVGFPPDRVSVGSVSARLVSDDLGTLSGLRDQLRDRRIRSVAKKQLLLNRSGESTSLMLNRQAAAAGVAAVCGSPEESPLGPFYLEVTSPDLDRVIGWLTGYPEG